MLVPARLDFAADGTPVSADFGDVYHSADGGPGQARHVFLHGNALPQRWGGRERFVILENGFGTGLNFLATWASWRDDPRRCGRLHYLALEKHPFRVEDLARLHARWPEFAFLAAALRAAWPVLTPGFHRLEFAAGRVVLTLLLGDAAATLRKLEARVDAFYLDGFDPRKNPEMWSATLFKRCAQLAVPDATLATWCVAGSVRAALREAGFATEKRPGFGRKREMLGGRLAVPHASAAPAAGTARRAAIVGAGLAGCAVAERLAARGWRVDLLDRHGAPAGEASGNLAAIVRPLLSRDDNLASRLNRACFLHAARAWTALDRAGHPARRNLNGVAQIARDAAHEAQQRDIVAAGGYPADYVQFLERAEAGALLGAETAFGGWWFPGGGWAHPPGLCRAWLGVGGDGIRFRGRARVAGMRHDGDWHLFDAAGNELAATPVVVLASGASGLDLPALADLPISRVRGQVSHLPEGALPRLKYAACREGYLTPAVDGRHCLGASYAYDASERMREEEHASNLQRLGRILPGAELGLDAAALDGRVGFRAATPDRLPLIGALPALAAPLERDCRLATLPRQPGLYGLLGLGSRGLVWAALAAEMLASRLEGEPMPVESDLLDAVDPGRFRLRAHRRGT